MNILHYTLKYKQPSHLIKKSFLSLRTNSLKPSLIHSSFNPLIIFSRMDVDTTLKGV